MAELQDREWGSFKIGDEDGIFTVSTGSYLSKLKLTPGQAPRITVKDTLNGVDGYYRAYNSRNYRTQTNFISVSFLGSVFYHPYTASIDMKVHALKLKNHVLNRHLALFLVRAIKNSVSQFSYGDQLSSSDLLDQKIRLPTDKKGLPDWAFMEQYVEERESKLLATYKAIRCLPE